MKTSEKNKKPSIPKQDFIEFLANAKPDEINDYIRDKGKPRKLCEPMYFFPKEGEETK